MKSPTAYKDETSAQLLKYTEFTEDFTVFYQQKNAPAIAEAFFLKWLGNKDSNLDRRCQRP